MESVCSSSVVSRGDLPVCINSGAPVSVCSDLFKPKKGISDVRRTFCLFVTFDLLFISLLWIIELNVNILQQLTEEALHYDFHHSFFDIFLLAVFRFGALILSYAVCRLHHWAAIATVIVVCETTLLTLGAFGYLLPISSFVLAWIETWLLDFKVLPQEAQDQASEQAPLLGPGPMSDGQFYSPPESVAGTFPAYTTSQKCGHTFFCFFFISMIVCIVDPH
uniref:MENTAL domain-containing protein n=1 Tax=Periophthalmus magnuspinnatus TaxID=409849 RepID=A0A3B4AUR3_9GOBI